MNCPLSVGSSDYNYQIKDKLEFLDLYQKLLYCHPIDSKFGVPMPGNAFMANQFSESNGFCTSVENAWSVEYNYGLRENRSDRQLQPKDL